jgi:putative membrane protein
MMYEGGSWFGMHVFWWIFWVVVIVAVAYVSLRARGDPRQVSRASPHEVLRRRYAAGELSTQEYEERKAVLDRDARSSKPGWLRAMSHRDEELP